MCKIAMMSGIKPKKINEAWMLAKALAPLMSKSDDDGYGYAAITKKGDVFVERWLDNDQAFRYKGDNKADKNLKETMGDAMEPLDDGYSSYGTVAKKEAVAIILHARMATCERGLKNVHPFIVDGKALIHNGVISNHHQVIGKYDANNTRQSTCDSEAIAFSYSANDVINKAEGISQVSADLSGYYACAVLGVDEKNNPIMDVFKSASANLYAVYVPQVECLVYSTSLDIIKQAIKNCGFSYNRPHKILTGKLIRHDAVTGSGKVVATFEERSMSYGSSYSYGRGYNSWNGHGYDNYYDGRSEKKELASETVINLSGAVSEVEVTEKLPSYKGATVIDGRNKPKEISWDEFLEQRYPNSSKVVVKPIGDQEANDLIVNEERVKELPTNLEVPKYILSIKDDAKRKQALQDFQEIDSRYKDFRDYLVEIKRKA